MKKLMKLPKLPKKILVKIYEDNRGYVAELTKYNVHTEASSKDELEHMINDLINGYFNIPKEYHQMIRYVANKHVEKIEEVKSLQILSTKSIFSRVSFA